MDSLFSTHPSTENRIRALEALASGMPAPAGVRAARQTTIPRAGRTFQ
jgi:heat shock protein HtpX